MKAKSTYSLLLNADSEEKGRSIFEAAVYSAVVLCTVLSVWHFASGSVVLPSGTNAAKKEAPASMIANAPVKAPTRG